MRLPADCPEWVERFLTSVEEKADGLVSKSATSDEALKASGAFAMWRFIREEVELEAASQAEMLKANTARLFERN